MSLTYLVGLVSQGDGVLYVGNGLMKIPDLTSFTRFQTKPEMVSVMVSVSVNL